MTAAAAFDALGDPTRRRILAVLAAGEQPVSAVVAALRDQQSISQPAVSQHLKILREAGLVAARTEGTRRLHTLDRDGLAVAHAWLDQLANPASGLERALDALATEVARGRRGRRRTGPTSAGRGTSERSA